MTKSLSPSLCSWVLVFDGSFEGFLTAIFVAYDKKLVHHALKVVCGNEPPDLLAQTMVVTCNLEQAARVFAKLQAVFGADLRQILWAFLSESEGIYTHLYEVIKLALNAPSVRILNHLTHPDVLAVAQAVKLVRRERHRMQAFVRFELTDEGIYFAKIAPDANVLPLIAGFFAKRFADQSFVIFDVKRGFGVYHDCLNKKLEQVLQVNHPIHDDKEKIYQTLWQAYFKHVTIAERKNLKLHTAQMPKRYWRYLTEKQAMF